MNNVQSVFTLEPISENVKMNWGWMLALGVVLFTLGIFASSHLVTATSATILYVGIMISIGGAFQIFHAFQEKQRSVFFYLILSGFFYCVAGIIAIQNPVLAAATLTLFLSMALIVAGIIRIWSAYRQRHESGWGWTFTSGLTTALAGMIFLFGWPINTIWILGMLLAIDLTFQGAAAIALSITLIFQARTKTKLAHISIPA